MDPSSMQYPTLQFRPVSSHVFDQVPQASMVEAQAKDSVLGLVIPFMHKVVKPKGSVISKIRCKAAWKYLLKFD